MKAGHENQLSFDGNLTHADMAYQLANSGYVQIEHHISDYVIDNLIEAYADFTDNFPDPPTEVMNRMIPICNNSADLHERKLLDRLHRRFNAPPVVREFNKYHTNIYRHGKPGGYTNRSYQSAVIKKHRGFDIGEDPKEYYHYDPLGLRDVRAQLKHYGMRSVLPPELERLHQRFDTVHRLGTTALIPLFSALEDERPEFGKLFRPSDFLDSPIRLLFYHSGQTDTLASLHNDQGGFTFQLAESHHGLRVRNPTTGDMQVIQRLAEFGVAFPGKGYELTYPDSPFKAAGHDVINLPEVSDKRHLYGKNVVRWAVILFLHSNMIELASDKTQTHLTM